MAILFSNATILPMTADEGSPKTFTGFVGVAGSRIALVTESASEADAFRAAHPDARIIDCTGRLVMPGLVNTHCHAAMTLQRSYADDIALMEWLHDYIWPFEARQTADDVANSPPAATGSGSTSHPIRPTPCRPKTCGAAKRRPSGTDCT